MCTTSSRCWTASEPIRGFQAGGASTPWSASGLRPHRDVDVAVRARAIKDAVKALQRQGFRVTADWLPVRVELSHEDRHVDLHPLQYRSDGSAWQAGLDGASFEYPAHRWVTGHIGDRPVVV